MATLSHSESRRLYSWWWDSHISPKNSKWLQENLTDMNAKVKTMIKLIEEDADSFAKRAEMYYKKRPELMKLVEDFYRAYRALAERYDHATGALRQAHRTIAEAFPNQDPFVLADDSPSGSSVCEIEPHTPESPHPVRVMLEPEDLHKDALGLSMSHFHAINRNAAKSDSVTNKKGLKQLNDLFGSEEGAPHYVKFAEGGMKKGLSYHKEDRNHSEHEKHIGYRDQSNHFMKENLKTQIKSSSERANKVETEVETLKVALAKLEAEKEAGLLQYQHALKRLSNLEAEVSHAQEDARGLNQRASKAETEVQTLNDALMKLQAEKEVGLLQYQQCIERMSNLENKFSHVQEDASINVETEAQRLKQALARVEAEKEASFLQYNLCLEKISNLETKVSLAEENARHLNERAVRAETEVKFLKEAIAKLAEEKEAAALQYQHSLETTSALQSEVSHAQEEATRLSSVIVMGVAKLSSIEEQYIQLERENQSLQSEIDTLEQVMTLQKQELSEKLEELEKLESCIEEEYRRTMEAEAAVQTLQNLHSECQEEREALALEVQNGGQRLKDKELEYQGLEEETRRVKEQNGILNEQNGLLVITEKSAQDEIFRLREAEVKLGKEIEVLGDQRKALQQEIYFLKEELDDLKKRNQNVIEQMELVGLKPDCFGSSVKSLYDENSRLQEICQKDNVEKESLSEKLKNMENTLEKNALLEDSLLGLNTGLELLREKVKTLEETCQSLKRVNTTVLDEKESLVSRLEMANRNVEKLLEKNIFLVNFLFDANVERAWLREKAKSLEEFCQSLDNENHDLFTAKDNLVSQFENIQQKLDDLVRKYTDLEENHSCLEKEMEAKVHQVEELQATLNLEKQEHASFIHSSETHLAHLEGNNRVLQEEGKRRLKEFEDEQDTAMKAQLEIFILQRFVQDLKERNLSLFIEYQNHLETSKLSENLATNLERENFEQQVKINSLLDRVERLRFGICQMALSLKNNPAYECQAEVEEDQVLQMAMRKLEDLESSLWSAEDERHHLLFEKSVFLTVLGQLRLEAARIESERSALHRDLQLRTDDLLLLQGERNKLRSETDNLYHQIGIGKDILSQKEMELSETKQKLKTLESENMELNSKLKDLSSEFEEARITKEVLEKKILNISENNSHKSEEIESLHEATEKLELELKRLHEEIKEQRVKEDNLSSELQQKRNEIKLWEYEAETMYCNCQATNIHAALFKEKAHELVGACESLEDERDSKTEDIEQLKERLRVLELENKGVKSKLAAYLPVVVSLRECVTSLEDRVILQTKNYEADNPEKEVADFASPQHDSNKELTENQSLLVADGVLDLLELQARIKKIETSVVEQKRLIMQESFDKNIKLDAAMRTILKLEQVGNGSSYRTEPDFSDVGNEILVKDIPLDQVSQCSSYDHGFVPQAMSRREDAEIKEEILELWDIVEQDLDLNLTFNQKQKLAAVPTQEKNDFCQNETVDQKSECPSSEIQSEEMSVASESVTVHQEGNKRKILERLASDAQKLMNLQVTVQDLRKKVEKLEMYKKPKDTEFTTVKEQLKEVEEAIMQLVGTNDKLSKKAERHPVAADGKLTVDLEETGKARRCRISERARRASEKIGRLHLEVQRIQFVLLKLEDKYKAKGTDRKVLLKDYLYGNLRSPPSNKRKKRLFFISCVKPPTSLD